MLLQSFLVIIGWVVVHTLSVYRDVEKNRRETITSIIDELTEKTDSIFSLSTQYHTEDRSQTKEVEIRMALQDYQIQMSGLKQICNKLSYEKIKKIELELLKLLRQSITLAHFADEHDAPIDYEDIIIKNIVEAVVELKKSLVELRNDYIKTSYWVQKLGNKN